MALALILVRVRITYEFFLDCQAGLSKGKQSRLHCQRCRIYLFENTRVVLYQGVKTCNRDWIQRFDLSAPEVCSAALCEHEYEQRACDPVTGDLERASWACSPSRG